MIKAALQYKQKRLGYRILLHLFHLFKFDNDDIKPCKIIIVKSSSRQIDSYRPFQLVCFVFPFLRWPTTVTSKPNAHIKFKLLTSNSNRSHQIQIAHSKFKSLTANYKSLTANYKSPTANSNRSQQIKVAHSKLKSLTANSNCSQQITNY